MCTREDQLIQDHCSNQLSNLDQLAFERCHKASSAPAPAPASTTTCRAAAALTIRRVWPLRRRTGSLRLGWGRDAARALPVSPRWSAAAPCGGGDVRRWHCSGELPTSWCSGCLCCWAGCWERQGMTSEAAELFDRFPPTDNDTATTARACAAFDDVFGPDAQDLPLQSASEDFSDVPSALGVPYTLLGHRRRRSTPSRERRRPGASRTTSPSTTRRSSHWSSSPRSTSARRLWWAPRWRSSPGSDASTHLRHAARGVSGGA